MTPPSSPASRRVLICGPVFPSIDVGGLPLALADVARVLAAHGWAVDLAITPDALELGPDGAPVTYIPRWSARRWAWTPRFRFLPPTGRRVLQHMLLGGGVARSQSDAMYAIDARLDREHYDAVIGHVHQAAPGFGRFITARHPRVLLSSLDGLTGELEIAPWLWLPRTVARLAPGRWHRDLFRPLHPADVTMAVFGSEAWRDDALRAGLPAHVARVIPFGVAQPAPLSEPRPAAGRLLWVGRLSAEKGLHVFLDALARLRRRRRVTLTAICAPGPDRYRRLIERRIAGLGLDDAVELRQAVPRADLPRVYAEHDALVFHSAFREPAALVLMEAFSAGLPVIAPCPSGATSLIDPDETCVCYPSSRPADVAAAMTRALDDAALREHVRRQARARIVDRFTLDAMGRAYDAALRSLLSPDVRVAAAPAVEPA